MERLGLCREEHLDLFVTWYQFGGLQHPPGLQELMAMPADLLKDFGYILSVLGRQRKERKALKGDK